MVALAERVTDSREFTISLTAVPTPPPPPPPPIPFPWQIPASLLFGLFLFALSQ